MANDPKGSQPGIAVDARGGAVVDPTANVLMLVEAANRRQDDLRVETNRRIDTELACVKEIGSIRAAHLKEISDLRSVHGKAMAGAETDRLNAIRQVDVLAVSTTAASSLAAIQRLAETSATNADNLRNAMTATASTIAQQTAATFSAITERLAALEKSMYEGAGKSKLADPAMAELLSEVKALKGAQSSGAGRSEGMQYIIGVGIAVAGIAIAVASYMK